MGYKEKIYDASPIFFQNFMTSTLGLVQKKARYNNIYYNYMSFLELFDKLSYDEKYSYQFKKFIDFVNFANGNSKYYNKLYKDIDLTKIKNFDDAKILPFVDKEMLRSNMNDVFTISERGSVLGHTGGTTGKPMIVRFTKADFAVRMASLDHFKKNVGFINNEMKRATFNCRNIVPAAQTQKVFWRYNKPGKQMIYSTFDLSEENMKYYVDSLNEFKPDSMDGFFMAMCDIASYIERHNIKLTFKPVALFPTCETLTERGRELLERVFGCKIYNQYASSEGAPFVTECKCGNLHMNMDSGYIERIDDESDEIAVTSFTTHGTPIIRYKIGDCMSFSDKTECDCGVNSQIINSIEGRKIAYVYASSGAKITESNISSMLKHIPNAIIQSQVVQDKIGVVDLYMVVDKELYKKEYEKLIYDEFYIRFGTDSILNIKYVDSIPRAKSGKFRLIINNVD
jgi:phenylacetate-CoA ligase